MPNEKSSDKFAYSVASVIILLLVMYLTAHYSRIYCVVNGLSTPVQSENIINNMSVAMQSRNKIDIFLAAMTEATAHPFFLRGIRLRPFIIHCITTCGFTGMFLYWYISSYFLRKRDMVGKEDGTSKWFNDWKMYNKKFISKYTEEDKKAGMPDPNMILGMK